MKQNLLSTRDGFGKGLLELGQKNHRVVALTANLAESTRIGKFGEKYPDRFFEVGVAEQNLAGIAAGLALCDKIPFMTSFGTFSPGLNWGQIRIAICYNEANVKIVATHCGLSVGADGAGHQMLEDIALMRVLPNMVVLSPADALQAEFATYAAAEHCGPVYLRLGREPTPEITTASQEFKIGKIYELATGQDVVIVATGMMVHESLIASKKLKRDNIGAAVYNCATIKPLNKDLLTQIAEKYQLIITAEEHQSNGGLGSAIAEYLSEIKPVKIIKIGVKDVFGQSGKPAELLQKFHLDANSIYRTIKTALK